LIVIKEASGARGMWTKNKVQAWLIDEEVLISQRDAWSNFLGQITKREQCLEDKKKEGVDLYSECRQHRKNEYISGSGRDRVAKKVK